MDILRRQGLLESTIGTPWESVFVRVELIYEIESEEDSEEGE